MIYLLRRRNLGKGSCNAIVASSTTGIGVFRSDLYYPPEADLVFRWGCTAPVRATSILNKVEAIHVVSDKLEFRKVLDTQGLCPKTWFQEEDVKFPAVVRPRTHHQGRRLWVCQDRPSLRAAISRCAEDFYASELINKTAEYRVFVVSGRVACVARKFPANPDAVAWNVYQGGRFENVRWDDWPLPVIKVAVRAFLLSGLDFGGVDIMVLGPKAYVLEINSAPSLTSPYRQRCFTKAFDWIVQKGKGFLPLGTRENYRKYIHPAIIERISDE